MLSLDDYRICLHYGCDDKKKKFKESENNKMKEKNKKVLLKCLIYFFHL